MGDVVVDRVAVTIPLEPAGGVDLGAAIPVFHGWIQRAAVPGTLVDVADYRHVHEGPAVMLVAHELDYALDLAGGALGMTVTRKRTARPAALSRGIAAAAGAAAAAIEALSAEDGPLGALAPATGALRIRVLDRRAAPTDAEGAAKVLPEVERAAGLLYTGELAVTPAFTPPGPVGFRIDASPPPPIAELRRAAEAASGELARA